MAWDESGYIWQAYAARTVFISNWFGGLWDVSKYQIAYPFLQSWYLGFMSLFLGFSVNSVRLASVLLLIPAAILMWSISRMIIPQRNVLRLLPVFLFLTSPMMAYYFSTAMKEGLGTVLTLLCFYLYFRAKAKSSPFFYLLTSLSLFILFLTKYNYAVLVAVPLAAESVWSILRGKGSDPPDLIRLEARFFTRPTMPRISGLISICPPGPVTCLPLNRLQDKPLTMFLNTFFPKRIRAGCLFLWVG